jgi:hypothetical protein
MADSNNHLIPTIDELEASVSRLGAAGLVEDGRRPRSRGKSKHRTMSTAAEHTKYDNVIDTVEPPSSRLIRHASDTLGG